MEFAHFVRDLLRALYHAVREAYYSLALRHVGDTHPDSWLIARRQIHSRLIVNDFLRKHTSF